MRSMMTSGATLLFVSTLLSTSLGMEWTSEGVTFSEIFKNNADIPKLLLFLDAPDHPQTRQDIEWSKKLSEDLLPRILPLAITNEPENAKIFSTFGIDKYLKDGVKLPIAMALDGGELKAGETIDLKLMKGAWNYANLLQFGETTGMPILQAASTSYNQQQLRLTDVQDFLQKCVQPGEGRCAIFATNSASELLALQKFKDVVVSFFSLFKRFHFMWCLGSELKDLTNIPHFKSGFPMVVLLDPHDKLLVPFEFEEKSAKDIKNFLSMFDSNATLPEIKEMMASNKRKLPQGKASKSWGEDMESEQLTLHEEL